MILNLFCLNLIVILFAQSQNLYFNFNRTFKPFNQNDITAVGTDFNNFMYVAFRNNTIGKYSSDFQYQRDMNNFGSSEPIFQIKQFNSFSLSFGQRNMLTSVMAGINKNKSTIYIVSSETGTFIQKINFTIPFFSFELLPFKNNDIIYVFGVLTNEKGLYCISRFQTKIMKRNNNTFFIPKIFSLTLQNTTLLLNAIYYTVIYSLGTFQFKYNFSINLINNSTSCIDQYNQEKVNFGQVNYYVYINDIILMQKINRNVVSYKTNTLSTVFVDSRLFTDKILQYTQYKNKKYLVYKNSIREIIYNSTNNSIIQASVVYNYSTENLYYFSNSTKPPFIWNQNASYQMGNCSQNYIYSLANFTETCLEINCSMQNCALCIQTKYKCEICIKGYFVSFYSCIKNACNLNCILCQQNYTCFQCQNMFAIDQKNLTLCKNCNQGYSSIQKKCLMNICNENCVLCFENFTCFVCEQKFVINQTNDNYCYECKFGYSKINNKCIKNICEQNCLLCDQNKICSVCSKYFKINQTDQTLCFQFQVIGSTISFSNSLDQIININNNQNKSNELLNSSAFTSSILIQKSMLKIPYIQQILVFLQPLFRVNNDYWYYLYHNRNYTHLLWTVVFLDLLVFISNTKMTPFFIDQNSIDIYYEDVFSKIFSSNYTNYTNLNVLQINKKQTYFLKDIGSFLIWNVNQKILLWIISNIIIFCITVVIKKQRNKIEIQQNEKENNEKKINKHNQLEQLFAKNFQGIKNNKQQIKKEKKNNSNANCSLFQLLKHYFFKNSYFTMIFEIILKQNAIFLGFYISLQIKINYFFNFADKINYIITILIFFICLFCVFSFYFLSYIFLKKKAFIFVQQQKKKFQSYVYLSIMSVFFFSHGFFQGMFLDQYLILINILLFIKVLIIFVSFIFVKVFLSKTMFVLNMCYYLFGIFYDILLLFSVLFVQILFSDQTFQLIEGICILSFLFVIYIQILITVLQILIFFIKKLYISIKQKCQTQQNIKQIAN